MEITAVERHKKNKNALLIFIDGKYSFTVSEEDYYRLNLYEKKQITEDELQYIQDEVLFRTAKATAIKYLSLKLRSEGEVRQKLEFEGYKRHVVDKVIEELIALGYINDVIYAQKYIYDRSKLKPVSKKLLKQELINKGISDDIVAEVLDGWKMDDGIVAEALIKKKFGKYDLKDEKIIKKVISFLKHRGFEMEVIEQALNKICNH